MMYYELLSQEHTVTAVVYATQLQKLAEAAREKRQRRASVHRLHDKARPHAAKATKKNRELG